MIAAEVNTIVVLSVATVEARAGWASGAAFLSDDRRHIRTSRYLHVRCCTCTRDDPYAIVPPCTLFTLSTASLG
jgi:hypothetical protein